MIFDISLTIPGLPIPQKRPRFSAVGRFVQVYDPQKQTKKQVSQRIKHAFLQACLEKNINIDENGPNSRFKRFFHLAVWFYMPYPDRLKKAHLNEKLGPIQHAIKPDVDNLVKFFMDCSNGILWPDDSMVSALSARKIYSQNPRTEVHLKSYKAIDEGALFLKIASHLKAQEVEEIEIFFATLTNYFFYFSSDFDLQADRHEKFEKEVVNFFQKYGDKFKKIIQIVEKSSKPKKKEKNNDQE